MCIRDSPHSLPSNYINHLTEDSLGNFWIATSKGLALYDDEQDQMCIRDRGTGTQQRSSKAKTTKIGTTIKEPLFGKELANVKVTSNRLAGACFYVVSGHGGPDPGAIGRVGKHELHEDEYAYDIALRDVYKRQFSSTSISNTSIPA